MNKKELAGALAGRIDTTKKVSEDIVESLVDLMVETLSNGEEIRIAGLGTFGITNRGAREGRNPATQEIIQIPASKAVKFKASKNLKEAVRG